MPAPQGNLNACKQEQGIQMSFYLTHVDVAYIRRRLTRELEREPSKQEIRQFARSQAKNGIYAAIKSEVPAIIV